MITYYNYYKAIKNANHNFSRNINNIILNKEQLKIFNIIKTNVENKFNNNPELYKNIKTMKGDTQNPERSYIKLIENIIIKLRKKGLIITFSKAGSQQPYDFRIQLNNLEILYIEAKKTDSTIIYFNDTLPQASMSENISKKKNIVNKFVSLGDEERKHQKYKNGDIYYLIIFTGNDNYNPKIIGLNGNEFYKDEQEKKKCFDHDYENSIKRKKDNEKFKDSNFSFTSRITGRYNIIHLF